MNKELKFDHFKNIEELLEHIDIWYKEDDIDYTRWFHLEDLKKVKDYITNLQQENKQLKDKIEKLKDYGEKVGERRNQLYDKIDKAIEYIKEHNVLAVNKEYLPSGIERCCSAELLEILGDKK